MLALDEPSPQRVGGFGLIESRQSYVRGVNEHYKGIILVQPHWGSTGQQHWNGVMLSKNLGGEGSITNRSRVAYLSLISGTVLTVRADLQRRHSLSLDVPYHMSLPGPRCPYPELSIAGWGWKLPFSGCDDSKHGICAERVFERYSAMENCMRTMRVIYRQRNDGWQCGVIQYFLSAVGRACEHVWVASLCSIMHPLIYGFRNPGNPIKQTAECRCFTTRMQQGASDGSTPTNTLGPPHIARYGQLYTTSYY